MLPARSDLFDEQYFNSNAAYGTLRDAMVVAVGPYSLKYKEMHAPILEGLQNAFNGVKTPQQAMDEASDKVNTFRTVRSSLNGRSLSISLPDRVLVWRSMR